MAGTIVSTTYGTPVVTPAPGTGLAAGELLWPYAANSFTSNKTLYPAGWNYITSVPAAAALYSTVGDPPEKVPFRVLPEYHESMTMDHQEVVHVMDVPWDLQYFFVASMLGTAYLDSSKKLRRILPQRHPVYLHLFCTRCECSQGAGVPASLNGRLVFYQRGKGGGLGSNIPFTTTVNQGMNQAAVQSLASTAGLQPGDTLSFGAGTATVASVDSATQVTLTTAITSVSGETVDRVSGKFGYARYHVTYSSLDYDLLSDAAVDADTTNGELLRYVSRDQAFSGENLTLTNVQLEIVGGAALGNNAVKTFPLSQTAITWRQVPALNRTNIQACIGKVNATVFDTVADLGINAAAEQVVYLGAKTKRDRAPTGQYTWEIQHLFAQRDRSWNEFFDKDLKPVRVQTKGTKQPPYPTADFGKLFQFT